MINEEDPGNGFAVGNNRIAFEDGQILLLSDGKIAEKCAITEFAKTPNAVFRRLMSYMTTIQKDSKSTESLDLT